jgi:hypothetical protein
VRILVWMQGFLVVALGWEVSAGLPPRWMWFWLIAIVAWFFIGLAVAIVGVFGRFLKSNPVPRIAQPPLRPAAPAIPKQGD